MILKNYAKALGPLLGNFLISYNGETFQPAETFCVKFTYALLGADTFRVSVVLQSDSLRAALWRTRY